MSVPRQECLPQVVIATADDELWEEIDRILGTEFTLCHLKTGREVVEVVERRTPNLVILDMRLVHPTAAEALYLLKVNEETRFVPVVAMSSGTQSHDELMQLGADASLSHPFSIDALLQRIGTVILN